MSKLAILGGEPLCRQKFPERKTMGEEEKNAVLRVLDSDKLSTFVGASGNCFMGGKEVRNFEKIWASTYGFNHAVSVNSWTTGLQVAVGSIGVEPGDEVICPPYTMSASASAVLLYGGIPIFADIDPKRYTIDPISVELKITPRTKAIMVVHLFGYPADMDGLKKIAKKYKLKIIEDAAQSPGVFYKGKPVGAIGDIGGFSLNYHKHIHTGEGGLIVTNDDDLARRSSFIRNHGENATEAYQVKDISNLVGSNYRFTELQAAIATEQFKKLSKILNYRQEIAKVLDARIRDIPGLEIQEIEQGSTHAYYMYPIKYFAEFFGVSRNIFLKAVAAELPIPTSWETTPLAEGYIKPLYLNHIYQKKIAIGKKGFPFNYNPGITYEYPEGLCPVTEKLYAKQLLITPLVREGMSVKNINIFADAIEKVIENLNDIKDSKIKGSDGFFDPVKAIDENVKN